MSNTIMRKFGSALGMANEGAEGAYSGPMPVNRPHLTIAVYSPRGFDDVKPMSDAIKEKRAVLVHFDRVDSSVGCRIIDYMNGLGYALDVRAEKVSDQVILYVPSNTTVERDPLHSAKTSGWF